MPPLNCDVHPVDLCPNMFSWKPKGARVLKTNRRQRLIALCYVLILWAICCFMCVWQVARNIDTSARDTNGILGTSIGESDGWPSNVDPKTTVKRRPTPATTVEVAVQMDAMI